MEVGPAGPPARRLCVGQRGGEGGRRRRAQARSTCRWRRSSPRSAARPPAASRRSSSPRWAKEFYDQLLANIKNGDTRTFDDDEVGPGDVAGRGQGRRHERGAARRAGALDRHQGQARSTTTSSSCRAPGTPRRATRKGQRSAYEAALLGTPVANPEQPLEVLRTIHSFDPCIACAVHLYDEHGPARPPGRRRSEEARHGHSHRDPPRLRLGVAGPPLSLGERARASWCSRSPAT